MKAQRKGACVLACLFLGLFVAPSHASETEAAPDVLERVRAQGYVTCGVDMTPGFSTVDEKGAAQGFEVDLCRAVAVAVLGDWAAIRTVRTNSRHKFGAVAAGELDIAFGMTTWSFERETTLGVAFPYPTFYDGQGFMVWADSGITRLEDLAETSVCVQASTTTETNLRDFLASRPTVEVMLTVSSEEKFNAFAGRRCHVITGDHSELAAQRGRRAAMPESWHILPGTISREPLGPVVTAGDPLWFNIVRWTMAALLVAEVQGLTQQTVIQESNGTTEVRRLTGHDPGFGGPLGLDPAWAQRVISSVGNYGEIFARNLAPLGMERGANALWRDGGLHFPPPLH